MWQNGENMKVIVCVERKGFLYSFYEQEKNIERWMLIA